MMKMVRYATNCRGLSEKGWNRFENQDCIHVKRKLGLYIIADGNREQGKIAAESVCYKIEESFEETIRSYKKRKLFHEFRPEKVLERVVQEANRYLFDTNEQNPKPIMGATVAVLFLLRDGRYYVANVGDSRVYALDAQSNLKLLTTDDTYYQIKDVDVNTEQLEKVYLKRKTLGQWIGQYEEAEIHSCSGKLDDIRRFLLSTDGLHDVLTQGEIKQALSSDKSVDEIAQELMHLADNPQETVEMIKHYSRSHWKEDELEKLGGRDNMSCLVVDVQRKRRYIW